MAERIFTVDKFFGLNEGADGTTELKLGEASKMENFYITDDYNLKSRPGICRYTDATGSGYLRAWTFFSGKYEYLATVRPVTGGGQVLEICRNGEKVYEQYETEFYNIFPHNGKICVLFWQHERPGLEDGFPLDVNVMYFEADAKGNIPVANVENPYYPLVLSGCAPSGGGKEIEKRNVLSRYYYAQYVGDGTSKDYVFTSDVGAIQSIFIDGEFVDAGTYNSKTHTFTFNEAPPENAHVEFECQISDDELRRARNQILQMPYTELFNGATDTRVFFYGDGSNKSFYSGAPAHGNGFYIPAGNELTVDFSTSPITGMVRHYSRLLAFKPDGVDAITYEPVTLADGSVIAGFFVRPVNRDYGNEATGQVALVNNHPRTFSGKSIYEWRISSSNYRDERYAKCVSEKVHKTLASADPDRIVVCDDDAEKTYYVFLNDAAGTVLVHRYDLDAWSIYRSALTTDVLQAFSFEGRLVFLRSDGLYCFDADSVYDIAPENAISCIWESGYMAFGADYKRKYSSNIWISMLPEPGSHIEATVQTDRRDEYLSKTAGLPLFAFPHLDFANFSFILNRAPAIQRIKIKVKKFVYYKLILRIAKPCSRATVLGYDQQIRYSANVK